MTRALPRGVNEDVTADDFPLLPLNDIDLRASLMAWKFIMGTEWFGTPGTAGADALEARIRNTKTWHATWKCDPVPRASESPYRVKHFDQRADTRAPWLIAFDVTRMYPTAAGVTDVCPGTLRNTGPIEFDKAQAGWWLADIAPWNWPGLPDPAGYSDRRHIPGHARWVTTPTLKLLADLHDQEAHGGFTVLDSWTGPGRPVFRQWNQGLEMLYRESPFPELQDAVKAAGRQTIGLLNSKTYSTYRPDWHYAVIAQARSNLFRKMWNAYGTDQRLPLAIDVDCVWYGSGSEVWARALPTGWKLGDEPGTFKVKGCHQR